LTVSKKLLSEIELAFVNSIVSNDNFHTDCAKSSREGVARMTRVEEKLYLGALRDAESLATSNPHGIRAVITLCRESVEHRSAEIEYSQFAIDELVPMESQFLYTILAAIRRSIAQGSALVHCLLGVSRSPAVLAAYLRRNGFSSYAAALDYIERRRPSIDPSVLLTRSIESALEKISGDGSRLPSQSKISPKGEGR
jgi:protein-tyrosine phosphatase